MANESRSLNTALNAAEIAALPEWLNLKQAMALANMGQAKLYTLMKEGLFPPNFKNAQGLMTSKALWSKAEILDWRSLKSAGASTAHMEQLIKAQQARRMQQITETLKQYNIKALKSA